MNNLYSPPPPHSRENKVLVWLAVALAAVLVLDLVRRALGF